jgi:hypothetical protein
LLASETAEEARSLSTVQFPKTTSLSDLLLGMHGSSQTLPHTCESPIEEESGVCVLGAVASLGPNTEPRGPTPQVALGRDEHEGERHVKEKEGILELFSSVFGPLTTGKIALSRPEFVKYQRNQ